ncbi:MAG: hypothetical protein M3521_04725 [Acidobacteriota bacterium]|jgi:hypothetical protein|nr:hypothetical protein [Acidobacteriota bacterium]MDQ3373177.1 hypothetical protein [Acidobacteriota bacterium]
MNKSKTLFSIVTLFIFCLLSAANVFAQPDARKQAEPVYEVFLQTLVASNNANAKTDVPQTLAGVIKKLKNNYTFNNYRVTSTYLERVSNTGSVDFKSLAKGLDQNQENTSPVFSEWTLNGLQSMQNSRGQSSIQFQGFRFGQRIPIRTRDFKDEGGKGSSVVNYEHIGLTLSKSGLPINEPTVIGSLSTANEELIFLVLTINLMEN